MKLRADPRTVVDVVFPTLSEAREKISGLAAEVGLEIRLLLGRVTSAEARLTLELRGKASNLAQGVKQLGLAGDFHPT